MIVFDLSCSEGHRFEGWFPDSASFAEQQARGLLDCPECGSTQVEKAPMAPAVGRKGNQLPATVDKKPVANQPLPSEALEMLGKLAKLQAAVLEKSTFVGDAFADDVRAMHYGEKDLALVHGNASREDARDLIEEGIAIAPLPFPVVQDEDLN